MFVQVRVQLTGLSDAGFSAVSHLMIIAGFSWEMWTVTPSHLFLHK